MRRVVLSFVLLTACHRPRALSGVDVTQGLSSFHVCTTHPLTGCEVRYGATDGTTLAFPMRVVRPVHSCDAAEQLHEALVNCDREGVWSEADVNRCVGEWGVLMRAAGSRSSERVERGVLTIRCNEGEGRVSFDRPSF